MICRGANPLSVLGSSRVGYVQFVTDGRLETLMARHEAAFAFIGGTPHEVLYDNMRTVVVGRDVRPRATSGDRCSNRRGLAERTTIQHPLSVYEGLLAPQVVA